MLLWRLHRSSAYQIDSEKRLTLSGGDVLPWWRRGALVWRLGAPVIVCIGMVEQALNAGIMRFDTCARGRETIPPSVLLTTIEQAGGGVDQATSDDGTVLKLMPILLHAHVYF